MKYKFSIHRMFFFVIIVFALITIVIFAFWEIHNLNRDFKHDTDILKQEYENEQKTMIKNEVQKMAYYIENLIQHYIGRKLTHDIKTAKEEILINLVKQHFGKEGYFFGSTYQGNPLFSNGIITIGTGTIWDLTDPNGVKIIQEQIQKAKEPEGGFVRYSWNKLGETKLTPKISYVMGIDELQWVIGAGIYIDEIEELVAAEKLELHQKVKRRIMALVIFSIFFLVVFYIIAKIISKKIKNDFDLFSNFFRNIENPTARIDETKPDFPEFVALANATNFMMEQREKAEEQVKKDLKEKTVLLQELFHRTKNNMAVISAMLKMQAANSNDEFVHTTFMELNNKIKAMSLVHEKLYQVNDLSSINLNDYIKDLVLQIKQSYSQMSANISLKFEMDDDIFILIDSALPLGLVMNEMVSNVFKHAFPNNEKGKITIKLFKDKNDFINFQISDNGIGIPIDQDLKKIESVGIQSMISIIKYQLNGYFRYNTDNGLKWHIKFKDGPQKKRV